MASYRGRIARALVLVLVLPACSVSGLGFRQDDRVEITSPPNHSTQRLPVTVRWSVRDFEVTGPDGASRPDAGYFAVFLDRAPQRPGSPIETLAESDQTCHAYEGCPDAEWFTEHDIYPTTSTEFTVEHLPVLTEQQRRAFHEVTVVLLDGTGQRLGESAFSVEFRVTA